MLFWFAGPRWASCKALRQGRPQEKLQHKSKLGGLAKHVETRVATIHTTGKDDKYRSNFKTMKQDRSPNLVFRSTRRTRDVCVADGRGRCVEHFHERAFPIKPSRRTLFNKQVDGHYPLPKRCR